MTPWNTWILGLRKELATLDFAGRELVVFASGGPDSTALLRLLSEVTKKGEGPTVSLSAVHCNYALRGEESDADQAFVEELCRALKVPLRIVRPEPPRNENVQNWARAIRLLEVRKCRKAGNLAVLGHTSDDLLETIMMRLGRGSRSQTLMGMRRLRDGIWRPLLHLKKAVILAEMARHQYSFRVDASNAQDFYTRNKLRHHVLPALESIYPSFGDKLIAHVQNHEQLLSQKVDGSSIRRVVARRFLEKAPKRARTRQFLRAFQPPNAILQLDSRAEATIDISGRWQNFPAGDRAKAAPNLWTVENVAACHKVRVRGYNELMSVQRLRKMLQFSEFIRLLRQNGEVVAVVDNSGNAHKLPSPD
jgi:tRNA(Ile)-lysidine synthetase-like protein